MNLLKRALEKQNKRGVMEFSILVLGIIIFLSIIIGILALYFINHLFTPIASKIAPISAAAGTTVSQSRTTFINFWDWIVIISIIISVLVLWISSFLIDTHPIFAVLWFIFGIIFTAGTIVLSDTLNAIYDNPRFALEVSQLPMLNFLRLHYGAFMFMIFFICGILMFAKFRWFNQSSGSNNYG